MTESSLNNCLPMSLPDIVQGVRNGTIGLHEGKVMMLGREVIPATTMQPRKSGTRWTIDKKKSNEVGLFVRYNDNDCVDREHDAYVKWDGCVELDISGAGSSDDTEKISIHLCELNDFIQALEELRDAAKNHFGKDWPE